MIGRHRGALLLALIVFALVVLDTLVAGCGAQHRGEPEGPAVQPDSALAARGEPLFDRFCYQCHPGGAAGLGPALNDKPLPQGAIRAQIRKGVGAMPAFPGDMLSDADVDAIVAYVEAMRHTPAGA
jgi:mono/diheme cytochrome c family protein